MKLFTVTKIVLPAIVLLAFLLRFVNDSHVPPSMYWDEVSQGYNAFSILKTGHDEHNEFFPLARFQAFGDYKAPVYIYLDVASIALFGKTTLGVRFPSVLLGTLTVLITYFLSRGLLRKSKYLQSISLVAAFLLAVSPWHIQLSRAAYEANCATFFTVLGVFLFLYAVHKKSWVFILSVVSFVFAFYSFNAHRVFVPIFVIFLSFVYARELFRMKKTAAIAVILGILLLIPILLFLRTPESKLRFNEVNIFTNIETVEQSNQLIETDGNSFLAKAVHNRRVLFAQAYLTHYFDFFNPSYLFFSGDINPRFSMQDSGELFLWELPILLAGIYYFAIKRDRSAFVIVGWFLLAPVAAATARETPHALRSETFIPTYEFIAAAGAVYLFDSIRRSYKRFFIPAICVSLAIVFLFIAIFYHNYFIHFPTEYSYDWQYGYKETVQSVEKIKKNYDYVVFTQTYGRPYIYVLFYSDMDPAKYPNNAKVQKDMYGFYNVQQVDGYRFRDKLISDTDIGKKVLYVAAPGQLSPDMHILKEIPFLNGKTAFILADNK
jgi:4-amino-4-deoxy-L-arabinose transferase-like glycosyltransferase